MTDTKVAVLAIALMAATGIGIAFGGEPRPAGEMQKKGTWALETSLTFPIAVQIYMAQFAYHIGENSEFLFGPCFQNWKDQGEAKGRAHAYTLVLGYRQYFWKNLHAEAELFPAYNSFDSSVDGKTYNGFEVWIEYRVGWKFEFEVGGRTLFITPQPGLGHALYLQKIWPGLNASTYRQGSLAFIPQILLGLEL
jgi:hypothetical protein